ncbi:unnamed protein product, partial [Closterium sp. NIES-53]
LVDFAARSRLDDVSSLVTESESVCPLSIWGELALGSDVLEDRQFELECLVATLPRFASMLLCPEGDSDALHIPTPRSYAEAIAGEYSSPWQTAMDAEMASWKSTGTYVDKVPPPGANIVDGMWIFRVKRPLGSPPAFKALYVARGFNQRQGVEFFQTFSPTPKMTTLRGSLHEEIWLRRPPSFIGTTLAALGFAPSSADPSLFLRTYTTLSPFYILVYITQDRARRTITRTQSQKVQYVLQRFGFQFSLPQPTPLSTGHSLSAPPSDESVELSGPYPELVGCLICEAEIYAGAMAAQELRWLTYLLTDLGERPRSPPVLYQRRQLRLSYVASRANTADVFTKALGSGDHQRFCTALGLVPTLPHLLVA